MAFIYPLLSDIRASVHGPLYVWQHQTPKSPPSPLYPIRPLERVWRDRVSFLPDWAKPWIFLSVIWAQFCLLTVLNS